MQMSSDINTEKPNSTSIVSPEPDDIAAALDEARQNARLLRVSSSLFLREAKELIDADKASVLVWASDFLEGSTEDAKERLQDLQQSTTSCGLPSVSVESKKLLAELVGLGKIGGRLRRQAICLLAVVLDPAGEDAPALTKLLKQLPQGPLRRKSSAPVPPPVTPSTKAAPSKSTVFRHHYTPDVPRFRAALSQKDSLPVLRRTGSLASSRRSSDAGQASQPETAQQNRAPAPIPEGAKLADSDAMPKADSNTTPKASTPMSDAAASAEPSPAPVPALSPTSPTPGAQPAAEPAKGAALKPTEALQAAGPVKAVPPHGSSSDSAAKAPATPGVQANGHAAEPQGADESAAVPPTPSPVKTSKHTEDEGAPAEQWEVENEPSAQATVSLSELTGSSAMNASQKGAVDAYTPGAGMPEAPRKASAEAARQEPAARAGSIARPEEVSAFRMTRRKRSSSAAQAPAEPEHVPEDAPKIVEPAAPSSSPADASEDDERPGHSNGKVSGRGVEEDVPVAPPSLADMIAPLEIDETEAAKAVWTGTPVEPSPSGKA